MKTRFLPLIAIVSGLMASTATAQSTPPVLIVNITDVETLDGTVDPLPANQQFLSFGSGYANVPPTVTFSGGGGSGAAGTAVLDPSGNAVLYINITNVGSGYLSAPTVTFSGGGASGVGAAVPSQAQARVQLHVTTDFHIPNQNEGFGPAGNPIGIVAVASGSEPAAGFTYDFTVDGLSVGSSPQATTPGQPSGILWTPPLPGVYLLDVSTKDGNGNSASSPAIRYFATGTVIVSPEAGGVPPSGNPIVTPGSLVPVGSTTVIQATSTSKDGFISRIDFYTDWTGSTATSTLIGSATNYPYFVDYTPTGAPGATHLIKAIGYDNSGVAVPPSVLATNPNQDEILLTMATPNPSGVPTATIITPSTNSLVQIPNYATDPSTGINVIVTAGAKNGASITKVELYINGVLFSTVNTYPYNFLWTPKATGAFALVALAYDTNGNVVPSTSISATSTTPILGPDTVIIEAAPAVAVTGPGAGAIVAAGVPTAVQAVAVDTNLDASGNPIPITSVQFYQDGNFIGQANSPVSGDLYQISFKPVQKTVNGVVVPSQLTAIATDKFGFQGTSFGVSVTVNSGGGTSTNPVVIGTPPTIAVTTPSNNANVIVNTPVTLSASGTAPNGNIAQVTFQVDGAVVATLTKYPYNFTYTFQNLGTYTVNATVTDNVGDTFTPATPNTVVVVTEPPPTVKISSPTSGGTVTTGSSVSVTANASSLSGTISQVEFFANGISIGVVTTPPYTVSFTPQSAGLYTFTSIATDGAGETTTSAPVIVEAFPASGGLGTTSYFGQYQGLTDGGRFAFMVIDGKYGTYIGHSNVGTGTATNFVSDIAVSPGGAFTSKTMTGNVSLTGVTGNLIPSQNLFIGAATLSGTSSVASGYYTGNILGVPGSQFTAIVGADGSVMAYIASGSYTDVADGSVDSTGAFTITTTDNNTFTGTIDPSTGFINGTLSGGSGGTILAARVSGGTFSDGVLKNLSTRGQIGTGANVMIAGFVVGGSAPKQLLVRAVGPTLSTFGLAGSIASTKLQLFSGATMISSNTGWSSTPSNALAVSNADAQVGAFALPTGSADSALVGSFPPGNYTAMVSGLGSDTGLGLVEIYDMDTFTPFTTMKMTNVSTRGEVGTGNNVLIGGFVINGTAPKRLLIRGAGPSLTALSVSGALATPHLLLFDGAQKQIRENYSWQVGNDAGLVSAAASATGAFAFGNGSADSAILAVLPPGTYTAEVAGANNTSGTALVEVYEVP